MRFAALIVLFVLSLPSWASEADAIAISANIRARHMPFGTILDPIFSSPTSNQIVGYTRCGDSALWTGAYLAAEAFHFKVTRSPEALANVKAALAGLKSLSDVTGTNQLARCIVPLDSPYAAGIQNEEASNTIHTVPPWFWVDNISRDQVIGAFFGLGVAYDMVDDDSVRSDVSDLVTRLIGYISRHQWSPDDNLSTSFQVRPEELQMLLQVARHVNPANDVSGPFFVLPVSTGVQIDVLSTDSYFKFNLDYMTFYHLVRLQRNGSNLDAYQTVRDYTRLHQNAFFDIIDRALRGPDAARDAEFVTLLDQWLLRPNRDKGVNLSKTVLVCGVQACAPVPVPIRPPADFLWQRNPFQLSAGGDGFIENPGVDYVLPYWMGRYYGVIPGSPVQSAAAPSVAVAPNSLASLFATSLAPGVAQADFQPLPPTLGGVTLAVTDATGARRTAPLAYVSPTQINFLVPDGAAAGTATFLVNNGSASQSFTGAINPVSPTLFSMNGTGAGVAAATAIRVQASNPGPQFPVQVFQCGATGCSSTPIELGVDTPVYVTFYGTGIRNRSSLANVNVTIHGMSVPVLYAGPSPGFNGLDQVNVALSLALRGSGESNAVLIVDGQISNAVTINIK